MPNKTESTNTIIGVETNIADSLCRFVDVFNQTPNGQKQLHDAIYHLENSDLLPNQKELMTKLLHASLSLSFLIIGDADRVNKFIEYHDA